MKFFGQDSLIRIRGIVSGLLLLGLGCGGPPALHSEEAHSAADALYTAVTSRRIELLNQCAADLKALSDDGRLSAEAYEALGTIVTQARSGDWQNAAEALDGFIRYQPPGTARGADRAAD